MSSGVDSVTPWLEALKRGEEAAARELFHEVFGRLTRLARRRLGGRRLKSADEEDVALSVFDSFCRRTEHGRFTRLRNRDDLWKLLIRLTTRKAKDYVRASLALKRGGGDVRGESALTAGASGGIDQAAVDELTPLMRIAVAEECRRLLAALDDDTARSIAVWKFEGYTDREIAAKLGCVERTVLRKVKRIRDKWKRLSPHAAGAVGAEP